MIHKSVHGERASGRRTPARRWFGRGWPGFMVGCASLAGLLLSAPRVGAQYNWTPETNTPTAQAVPAPAILPGTTSLPQGSGAMASPMPIGPSSGKTVPGQLESYRATHAVNTYEPGKSRLWRLGQGPEPLGAVPRPTAYTKQEYGKFVGPIVDPEMTLDLVAGRARLVTVKDYPKRIQIADETVATYGVVSPTEITIMGRQVGTTVLNFWFADAADSGKQKILSYLLRVSPDPELKDLTERVYEALEGEINHSFPDSHVNLRMVGDTLVVSGEAKDLSESNEIIRIVRANGPKNVGPAAPVDAAPPTPGAKPSGSEVFPPQPYENGGRFVPQIINMLHIPGEQQVMLKVTVAEVNRTAARSIGLDFNLTNEHGLAVVSNTFGGAVGLGPVGAGSFNLGFGPGGIATNFRAGDNHIGLAIRALRDLNYARSLAEPNLVTLNGQTANFQAGGQFPIPQVAGFGAAGLQSVGFVPFGVQLSFTPFITDHDRIRLSVAAEVSTLDNSSGANIGGAGVPGINTRNFQTTVELREGQTLAVAGLIQNSLNAESIRLPFLGDLPIIGHFAANDRISAGEQELVVLITPELVHPLECKEVPPLPGSDLFEPSDLEFYLLGRLESRRCYDYRSPVMNDLCRMKRYRECEQLYIFGPHGYSDCCGLPPDHCEMHAGHPFGNVEGP